MPGPLGPTVSPPTLLRNGERNDREMTDRRAPTRFLADTAAIVRSDERLVMLFLFLLSVGALAVFLHYTTLILDGLPNPIPTAP